MSVESIEHSDDVAEQLFKRALVELLKKTIIKDPETRAQAIAEAIAVTGRSRSSVHNWFGSNAGNNVPDIVAFFKLATHYNIDLRGADMLAVLRHLSPNIDESLSAAPIDGCMRLVSLGPNASTNHALLTYTPSPSYAVLMPYNSDDMAPDIGRGELILVDVSVEKIEGSGIYLVQMAGSVYLRVVEPEFSTGMMKLSAINSPTKLHTQTVKTNDDGTLPNIAIHGRLVGVLKESVIHFNRPASVT